jgi:hypothetical protein
MSEPYSWPVYVATARRVSKLPAALVIMLCPDPTEAAKCRQLIRARYSGFGLAPIVIDSSDATGRDGVGDPYLTVFAASMGGIDMESEDGARQVLEAITSAEVSDADRLLMTTIALRLSSDAARQILEAMTTMGEYQKTLAERIYDEGFAEALARAKAQGKIKAVLRILEVRRLAPSREQREQIMSCTDVAQLVEPDGDCIRILYGIAPNDWPDRPATRS